MLPLDAEPVDVYVNPAQILSVAGPASAVGVGINGDSVITNVHIAGPMLEAMNQIIKV